MMLIKRGEKMKKKVLVAVLIIIVIAIGVIGYFVISDMGQEDKLKTELTEINDLSNVDSIDINAIMKD